MQHSKRRFFLILLLAAFPFLIHSAAGQEIILGQSCALTGPTSFLGKEMNWGARSYFRTYADGEVLLKVLDDQYEPEQCIQNTALFIRENVTALFGYVGTPTSKAALPSARQNKMLFFGAFTGAGFLSDVKTNPYTFSVRAGYDMEVENMIRHLKDDLNITRIGLFVQRDAFGLAGIKAAAKALKKISEVKITPPLPEIPTDSASEETWNVFWNNVPNYKRNTIKVGREARKLSGNRVEAVIMVGASRPCAAAINLWHHLNFNAVFINISFVGSVDLAKRCKSLKNVFISQVVPDPWNSEIPIVREYHQAVGNTNYGFVSLEGFIAAKVFHYALKRAKDDLTANHLKTVLESMSDYDYGGLKISFGPRKHRGMDSVWLTKAETAGSGNRFVYINKLERD